ncbi:MAG: N-6 DNA methylase [Deltaproteobacteria bacterium]|nr:N-6 DNA methylase [Deltaproteobacteria bacterium]
MIRPPNARAVRQALLDAYNALAIPDAVKGEADAHAFATIALFANLARRLARNLATSIPDEFLHAAFAEAVAELPTVGSPFAKNDDVAFDTLAQIIATHAETLDVADRRVAVASAMGHFYPRTFAMGACREGRRWRFSAGDSRARASGTVFTPDGLAQEIAHDTLATWASETGQSADAARLCDPAVGTGHFLLHVPEGLRDRVHGVDLDGTAIGVARLALALAWEDFDAEKWTRRLRVGNALIGPTRSGQADGARPEWRPFDWAAAFPEVFDEADAGFDVVVGNPPYLSFGLRDLRNLDRTLADEYRRRFPDSAQYKLSVYALFVDRTRALLREGGAAGLLLPDSYLTGRYFERLRTAALDGGRRVRGVRQIRRTLWPSVHAGTATVLTFGREATPGERVSLVWQEKVGDAPSDRREYTLPCDEWRRVARGRFVFLLSDAERKFFDIVTDGSPPLSSLVRFSSGLIGRQGRSSILHEAAADDSYAPVIESGRQLAPFRVEWTGRYVRREASVYKSGYRPEMYAAAKVLVNQTGEEPRAAVDREGYFAFNSLHVGNVAEGVEKAALNFVAGVLNSRVGRALYRMHAMETGRPLAQIDIDLLESLPMPRGCDTYFRGNPTAPDDGFDAVVALARSTTEAVAGGGAFDDAQQGALDAAVLRAFRIDTAMFDAFLTSLAVNGR